MVALTDKNRRDSVKFYSLYFGVKFQMHLSILSLSSRFVKEKISGIMEKIFNLEEMLASISKNLPVVLTEYMRLGFCDNFLSHRELARAQLRPCNTICFNFF